MFGNRKIAAIKGKCHRFRKSVKCLDTHCATKNRPIWRQNVLKEAQRCGLQTSVRVFTKIFCLNDYFYSNS